MIHPVIAACNVRVTTGDARTGVPLGVQHYGNLVVLAGRNLIRDRLTGSGTAPSHVAIGTSSTTVTPQDTLLDVEVYRAAITTTTLTDAAVSYRLFVGGGTLNGSNLREAGIFNSATTDAGDMLARVVFDTIAKTSAITVTFDWLITIGASS